MINWINVSRVVRKLFFLGWQLVILQHRYVLVYYYSAYNNMPNTITWVFIQYFADRDIFCAGRVTEEDLQRVAAATGGTVQTSVNNVIDEVFP